MFNESKDSSTAGLIRLCIGYFTFYVLTGVLVKYFQGSKELGLPDFSGIEYLVYSTLGGTAFALSIVFALKWYRFESESYINIGPLKLPREVYYIIPSGICTAVVIPTTTLLYSLPISVMVAMVIMRGSVIVISRVVDAIQIKQGLLKKKVYLEENLAVVFAILGVSTNLFFVGEGEFEFVGNFAAMAILISYILAYSLRIYIMNYYKNTRTSKVKQDNKAFFGLEQIFATLTMLLVFLGLIYFAGSENGVTFQFRETVTNARSDWFWAVLAGVPFGAVAFFSVFIFMYKGRTATFAGLVNRLTSLLAGTTATLIFAFFISGKYPDKSEWLSLIFILVAVGFITRAEKKRIKELQLN
ncbi:MAG: hypothetical protein OZ913_03365 [Ignavibacteriaceae bacterium]|jgi:hypothetical protein|nr:MAG: hypothetical protein EDM69_06925 [Chlorobiota bacterium]KXK06249.1 MAG: hypothetical protein UZ04_CHB001000251 [Chlorobi bacterium OLB4]MBV6399239.1 hypothetical protein [Ignavibacteria bacterium]MCC6884912.1 hypothetical protein [Ignavibacteriales bacterium]MCE7953557.1 hypothetical protein [Chlorobi bacterium CHB7]MDL1887553.1 hypothetical protein [Ignavibacteria bacterium CHB1]MEB2329319.1 hypothetical protein [Ignavibacteriaceae bacterium]OQY78438.1 MAG: hypothetical protein B6D4